MKITAEDVGATTAIFSAVTALGAWVTTIFATRAGGRAADAAKTAATAAKELTRIETRRLHADFKPELRVSLEPLSYSEYQLSVSLNGPVGLARLDRLMIVIRDDNVRASLVQRLPAEEDELRDVIFSPLTLSPGINGADSTGRIVAISNLVPGRVVPFTMKTSRAPSWYAAPSWRAEFEGQPLKLLLDCRHEEFEPWLLYLTVDIPPNPHAMQKRQ